MPNHTVSGNVDTMMRAADNAGIRSAIGVGTTDAPTFLAQTLTGQSLTGTQATSLVDLSATWNTTGTPSALKLNVTDTASNAASNLMDLQVGGASKFKVNKSGRTMIGNVLDLGFGATLLSWESPFLRTYSPFSCAYLDVGATGSTLLTTDAPGILAQRNGTNAQAFRVYDSYTDAANYRRANFSFNSNRFELSVSSLGSALANRAINIGTYELGSIEFFTNGTNRWQISGSTGHLLALGDNLYDIGAGGANRPRNVYAGSDVISRPSASITPANNGQFVVEATSNTTLTLKLKGTDGTVRSVALTLA